MRERFTYNWAINLGYKPYNGEPIIDVWSAPNPEWKDQLFLTVETKMIGETEFRIVNEEDFPSGFRPSDYPD